MKTFCNFFLEEAGQLDHFVRDFVYLLAYINDYLEEHNKLPHTGSFKDSREAAKNLFEKPEFVTLRHFLDHLNQLVDKYENWFDREYKVAHAPWNNADFWKQVASKARITKQSAVNILAFLKKITSPVSKYEYLCPDCGGHLAPDGECDKCQTIKGMPKTIRNLFAGTMKVYQVLASEVSGTQI